MSGNRTHNVGGVRLQSDIYLARFPYEIEKENGMERMIMMMAVALVPVSSQ